MNSPLLRTLLGTLFPLAAAIGCSGGDRAVPDSKLANPGKVEDPTVTPLAAATRIDPEPNAAMVRALNGYAPQFHRFAASEYAPGVDTTYRADGDFNVSREDTGVGSFSSADKIRYRNGCKQANDADDNHNLH